MTVRRQQTSRRIAFGKPARAGTTFGVIQPSIRGCVISRSTLLRITREVTEFGSAAGVVYRSLRHRRCAATLRPLRRDEFVHEGAASPATRLKDLYSGAIQTAPP